MAIVFCTACQPVKRADNRPQLGWLHGNGKPAADINQRQTEFYFLFVDWFVTKERLDELVNDPTEFILMGVDTSDAINKDACTLVLRRMKTGENIGVS